MKITDMSDDQIIALTEEQLDLLIKVECMEQGVPLEPNPPEQSFFELPKGNLAFKVKGTEFYFESREDADTLAKVITQLAHKRKQAKYDWRTGYDIEWLENYDVEVIVEEKNFYDKAQVQDRESFLVKRKTLKEQYEKDKGLYDKSREKVRKISDDIYGIYYEARKESERVNRYKTTFEEYIKLAGGDEIKARAFFDKAYKDSINPITYAKLFEAQA